MQSETANQGKTLITICLGSSCFSRGNNDHLPVIQRYLEEHGLQDRFVLKGSRCEGLCLHGPNLRIGDALFQSVGVGDLIGILDEHL